MYPEIVIRPFVAADQPAARQLILGGLGEHFGFVDETLNPDLDDILAHYIARGHTFVVAEAGGKLAGTGALKVGEGQGQIVRMSVAPGFRRRGVGQRIVEHLLDVARRRRLNRLIVETNHDWYDALRLYQRCGFVEYDRDEESMWMRLRL
jgi:GNAT superfamily N-acetyltransferase